MLERCYFYTERKKEKQPGKSIHKFIQQAHADALKAVKIFRSCRSQCQMNEQNLVFILCVNFSQTFHSQTFVLNSRSFIEFSYFHQTESDDWATNFWNWFAHLRDFNEKSLWMRAWRRRSRLLAGLRLLGVFLLISNFFLITWILITVADDQNMRVIQRELHFLCCASAVWRLDELFRYAICFFTARQEFSVKIVNLFGIFNKTCFKTFQNT